MKYSILITEVVVLLLTAATLSAQTEDALLLQFSEGSGQSSATPNAVNLQQEGLDNEAYILQVTEASTNTIKAVQAGDKNAIDLMQHGNYINVEISQEGDENLYEADIEGQDSRIDVTQSGYENFIFQSLTVDNSAITIHQNGNQNELIHTGTSTNSGIQVQQQGSGMRVIIQTN